MGTQTVKKIIDDRGGYIAVAAGLSRPGREVFKTTVHTWYRLNKMPWWRMEAVLALPKKAKPAKKAAAADRQAAA